MYRHDLKETQHKLRSILYECVFFDGFYEVFADFGQMWVTLKIFAWETYLDPLYVTWEEPKIKGNIESFALLFWRKQYNLNPAVFGIDFNNYNRAGFQISDSKLQ